MAYKLTPTYHAAHAAGRDAGNRKQRELGLKTWNQQCKTIAIDTFHKIYKPIP